MVAQIAGWIRRPTTQPAWRGRGRGGWSCHTSDTAKRERGARETAVSLVCHGRAPVAPSRSFTRASTQIIEKKRGTSRHTCGWLPTMWVPASKCQRYLWHSPLRSFHPDSSPRSNFDPDSSPLRSGELSVQTCQVGNHPRAKWGIVPASIPRIISPNAPGGFPPGRTMPHFEVGKYRVKMSEVGGKRKKGFKWGIIGNKWGVVPSQFASGESIFYSSQRV